MIRALYGGSFDPVHNGHVALVQHLLANLLAEEIHVVPAWVSPLKFQTAVSATHRLAMAELAYRGDPRVHVDDREIVSGAPCFSYDTLLALRNEFPEDQWRLVIGADNLSDFHRWHRHTEILASTELVVFARDGYSLSLESWQAEGLRPDNVIIVADFSIEVSATQIRERLSSPSKRKQVLSELPDSVADYIVEHDLYRSSKNAKDSTST